MDDPYDLILGMFALAVTAVMLVAGELYLVTRPEPPETLTPAGLDSNIIHPVTWLTARNGGNATADFSLFGEKLTPRRRGLLRATIGETILTRRGEQ
jgi:hypothetical protein